MKRARKKRGWVYRLSIVSLTSLTLIALCLSVVTTIWEIEIQLNSGYGLNIKLGSIEASYFTLRDNFDIYIGPVDDIQNQRKYYGRDMLEYHWWGIRWDDRPHLKFWMLSFPSWPLVVALSIWPITTAIIWLKTRPQNGHCPACGYDLRGSPSGECPECGADAKSSGKTAKAK